MGTGPKAIAQTIDTGSTGGEETGILGLEGEDHTQIATLLTNGAAEFDAKAQLVVGRAPL